MHRCFESPDVKQLDSDITSRHIPTLMNQRNDINLLIVQVKHHAPGMDADFTQVGVIHFTHHLARSRVVAQCSGFDDKRLHHVLGIDGSVLGNVIMDGF